MTPTNPPISSIDILSKVRKKFSAVNTETADFLANIQSQLETIRQVNANPACITSWLKK